MASTIVTAMGAMNTDSGACPPKSALGWRVPGSRPNTTNSATGMPSTVAGAAGSRRNSFASVLVSMERPPVSSTGAVGWVARE